MKVEVIRGAYQGMVLEVREIGTGNRHGQLFVQLTEDKPYTQNKGTWLDDMDCREVDEAGYKQMTVDDVIEPPASEQKGGKISRDDALAALVTLGKITAPERLKYIHEKDLLDPARCNFITDMLIDFMNIGEPKVKRARGQRGKGKKEAAVLVSLRIPADVLKQIDTKAAFNGLDRTAMILSILSKGY